MRQQTFEEMQELYATYNRRFNRPCLVHATTKDKFASIIKSKMIKRTIQAARAGSLEKEIGLGEVIWLSPGFMYNAFLHDKNDYAAIFSPEITDNNVIVYKCQIIRESYATILRELKRLAPEELELLRSKSTEHRQAVDRFFAQKHFSAWQIKEDIYSAYRGSKKRAVISAKLAKLQQKSQSKTAKRTIIYRYQHPSTISGGEIVAQFDISLDRPQLLGFFVRKNTREVQKAIQAFLLRTKHVQEIAIFDGKTTTRLRKTSSD